MNLPESNFQIDALDEFGVAFDCAMREQERRGATRLRRVSAWRPGLALAGAAALLIGLAFTPPGRAIAEAVGELVGIGKPSSVHEPNLRDPRLDRTQEVVGPAFVAASGTVPFPDGEPFEIVAWAAKERSNRAIPAVDFATGERTTMGVDRPSDRLLSCLGVVFPDRGEQESAKYCAFESPFKDASHVFLGGSGTRQFGSSGPTLITDTTGADVARVQVTYADSAGERAEAPATLGRFDAELLDKTGATVPFGLFVAFVPSDGALRSVEVTTFDDAGRPLEQEALGGSSGHALEASERSRERHDDWARCVELIRDDTRRNEFHACAARVGSN